ncbi:hypothetical protein FQN54_004210 [Arachnomyces sp. PD_36]|nr:hypothetical protein FQN54_004210 [Arachnomyces sp. PD_36]
MSAGLPWLRSLRKSELVALAEISDLKDFEDYKKPELEGALDEHLSANKSIFSGEAKFHDYYRRLAQPPRASPVKREPKTEVSPSGDEAPKRPSRLRRQTKVKEEADTTSEESDSAAENKVEVAVATPARSPYSFSAPIPPSPAVVADAVDRQTRAVRKSVSEAWGASGLTERSDALRSLLSSVTTIEALTLGIELYGLAFTLIPFKYVTTVPSVQGIHTPDFAIKAPDLFVLLTSQFWAPFSLWLTTSLFLPLLVSYFFNLSLKAQTTSMPPPPKRGAAARSNVEKKFDPLVFNISKALVAYFVYANHFTFWNVFSNFSIERANSAIPGGYAGVLTGAAVGGIGSVYEAILRR